MIFMQDNAGIHTAKKVKKWFEDQGIPLFSWPPYSPDMNPIEIVWAWLKQWIEEHYPGLKTMGVAAEDYEALYHAIEEGWEAIEQDKIDALIKSMDHRVEALRLAKGWHTKY